MPRFPRPRTLLLFALPIAAHAGTLALWPPETATLEGAVPRLIATCAIVSVVAWLSSAGEERGAASSVASLALAALGAGAFAFVGCLAYALASAGGIGGLVIFAILVFALMASACAAVIVYVLGTAFDVGPATAVAAMATHVAVLAPLIMHPARPAAIAVAAIAAAACLCAPMLRKRKPAP